MRSPLLLGPLAAIFLLAGCFRHDYYISSAEPEPAPVVWQWNHHLFWGIVRLNSGVPLDGVCPQGVAYIENWIGPLQVVLSVITGGIYTPTTVRVWCGKSMAPVEVDVALDREAITELERRVPDLEAQVRRALRPDAPAPF